jgi:protein-disulfide isomerase
METIPPQQAPPMQKPLRPWVGFLLVVGVLICVLLGFVGFSAWMAYSRLHTERVDLTAYSSNEYSASSTSGIANRTVPRSQIETADDPTLGPSDALVTIVEFGDFECPYCATAMPVVKDLLARYSNRIRFIFRDFPNPSIHPNATNAAHAAACTAEQGKFWQYHDLLYLNQSSLESDALLQYAREASLNVTAFEQCQRSQRHTDEIIGDSQAGIDAGVVGTPTWFVNGVRIEGVIPFDEFQKIVEWGLEGRL